METKSHTQQQETILSEHRIDCHIVKIKTRNCDTMDNELRTQLGQQHGFYNTPACTPAE
jgi:hypothetical protein